MNNKLIIVSAPSGAGKTTIVKALLEHFPQLEFSISAASRKKRDNEIHGNDYYFIAPDVFRQKIENNEFVEWEEVYEDQFYGTLKSELHRIWEEGRQVIFDVDVVGGLNIKKQYPEQSLSMFIQPPDEAALEERLRARQTENEETLKKRIGKAKFELGFADKFDTIVINDILEEAVREAIDKVQKFLDD